MPIGHSENVRVPIIQDQQHNNYSKGHVSCTLRKQTALQRLLDIAALCLGSWPAEGSVTILTAVLDSQHHSALNS